LISVIFYFINREPKKKPVFIPTNSVKSTISLETPAATGEQNLNAESAKTEPLNSETLTFASDLDGWFIESIQLTRGKEPSVILSEGVSVQELQVGDNFAGYLLREIHRNHIILTRDKRFYHLNKPL
ncbi:MAG: hypothetical protein K8S56_07395, partial [Candidatus Cloacimonetes bacterium]|nr:hypothetical protein [Candidatus Cloacimonadota bacterium]